MNIQPLGDRVLVLPAPAEEKIGGIIIPDTAKEKPLRGKIVSRRVTRCSMANMQVPNWSLTVRSI